MRVSRRTPLVTAATALLWFLSTTVSGPASAAPRMTHITVTVEGCEGCRMSVYSAPGSKTAAQLRQFRDIGDRIVRHGRFSFTVPTSFTRGMAIRFGGGGYQYPGSAPNVTFSVVGKTLGSHVTDADARHARAGYACWAGTSASRYTLHLAAFRFLDYDHYVNNNHPKRVRSIAL